MEEKLDRIIELLEELVKNSTMYNGYQKWCTEQDNYLIDLYNKGLDIPDMINAIKNRFDIERSQGAIIARLSKLQLTTNTKRPLKKDYYHRNEEEDNRPIMDRIYASTEAPF